MYVLHQLRCLQPPEHPPSRAQALPSATISIFQITAVTLYPLESLRRVSTQPQRRKRRLHDIRSFQMPPVLDREVTVYGMRYHLKRQTVERMEHYRRKQPIAVFDDPNE